MFAADLMSEINKDESSDKLEYDSMGEVDGLLYNLSRAVEQSSKSIVILHTDGTLQYANPSFVKMTGYQLEEIIGKNPFEYEWGMQLPDIFGEACETIITGGEWRTEKINKNRSGTPYWEAVSVSPIRNADDIISHYLITKEDITKRKKIEREFNKNKAELLVKHAHLQGLLNEVQKTKTKLEKAYSELKATQAQVVQQEKMASIGQLAAGVAHEINNPMAFISSNLRTMSKYIDRMADFDSAVTEAVDKTEDKSLAQELRSKRKSLKLEYMLGDGRALLEESLDGAERVRTIVQNLKNFSRVDEAECKEADINECLNSTISIAWNELKYKVNLVKELGDLPPIKCHPQQINQVFMNLLVNAGQAIEQQGEVTVRTWHDDAWVCVSISDNGCGIPSEIINRIFEPFYTTKEVGKGTGLGLSITYDIVKKHDGEIAVESEIGKGTTFTVRLPVAR